MALRRIRFIVNHAPSKSSVIFLVFCLLSLTLGWLCFDRFHYYHYYPTSSSDAFSSKKARKSGIFSSVLNFDEDPTVGNENVNVVFRVNLHILNATNNSYPRNSTCNYWSCFNSYRCGYGARRKLSVYIYPEYEYRLNDSNVLKPNISPEYLHILNAIRSSEFNENDSNKSCLFIPSVDTLNLNRFRLSITGYLLNSLPFWNGGENHLLFNMFSSNVVIPTTVNKYSNKSLSGGLETGRAIVAGGEYNLKIYRQTFDISIPVFNSISLEFYSPKNDNEFVETTILRRWRLILPETQENSGYEKILLKLSEKYKNLFLPLRLCNPANWNKRCDADGNVYDYPLILKSAQFCLVLDDSSLLRIQFSDALMMGCIPVVVSDIILLPFFEVIDWKRAALVLYVRQLSNVMDILLNDISSVRLKAMQTQGRRLWLTYFSSPGAVALAALKILEERVFPETSLSYEEWNLIDDIHLLRPPLFLPRIAPNAGFTAVILTYDRLPTLFKAIEQLAGVQSLAKIIVVWNNPQKQPPPASAWPLVSKPIKVVKMATNKLSNRFLPFEHIETEAVFSLDDDITMLNKDELEFAFQAWREYPSYLVGFPSRVHTIDTVNGRLAYNSEWTNNISMILTGAAFYHKYYNYLFTTQLRRQLRDYVDDITNCEDILMNFLIANLTNQPALKVTPRKKFRTSEYIGHDLSTDSGHLKQRTECLNKFEREFNGLTLKSVEFRLDPVLYKVDEMLDGVLKYKDVGPL